MISELNKKGYVIIREHSDEEKFISVANNLGRIINDTQVKLFPGGTTFLASPKPIPFHTDHPTANYIAWTCLVQDEQDGAIILIDGFRLVESLLDSVKLDLTKVRLPARVRKGISPTNTSILSDITSPDIFYAPWLEPVEAPSNSIHSLIQWRTAIASAPNIRITLEPGHILIINNKRMLHGRDKLMDHSLRCLRRLWIEKYFDS